MSDAFDIALRLVAVFVVFLVFPLVIGQTEHKVMAHMQGRLRARCTRVGSTAGHSSSPTV